MRRNQEEKPGKDSQNLTAMLLFVSIAYLVTTLPYRVITPIIHIPEIAAIYDMTRLYWRLRLLFGVLATANLWFCNNAVNFYLYCIGGGKRYRNDTKEVIGQLLQCLFIKHQSTRG
jgi:hypothetical protein